MKLTNESGCPAQLFTSQLRPGTTHASLLARARFRLGDRAELLPLSLADQPPDLRREPIEDDYAIIEPDEAYPRTGTDVIVLADAMSHAGPTIASTVELEVGPYHQTLLVIGDRTWHRTFGRLVPSDPLPFERMPLTYARAFGGCYEGPHGPVAYPANPVGKGYYPDSNTARGAALPNIEDPQSRVRSWDDHPEPVGFAPYPGAWSLRLLPCVELDPEGQVIVHPQRGMFDRAHPRLAGRQVSPGDRVRIIGTAFAPVVEFSIPACPFDMFLRLGGSRWYRTLDLEELLIDLRVGVVEFSYRKLFQYQYILHQRRDTTLRLAEPDDVPADRCPPTIFLVP